VDDVGLAAEAPVGSISGGETCKLTSRRMLIQLAIDS
jgi:hypothetical protein